MTIGQMIKRARLQAGLTQVELADRIHISQPGLVKIEKDQSNPEDRTLKLAAIELHDDFGQAWLRDLLQKEEEKAGTQVKIEGRVAAGKPFEAVLQGDLITIPSRMRHRIKRTFALQVVG